MTLNDIMNYCEKHNIDPDKDIVFNLPGMKVLYTGDVMWRVARDSKGKAYLSLDFGPQLEFDCGRQSSGTVQSCITQHWQGSA